MRISYAMVLAVLIGLQAVAVSVAQERSLDDVRNDVLQLCQKGEVVSAVGMAMKSLLDARLKYGEEHPITVQCMIMVADVARHRQKYYLAGKLYSRALLIEEKAFGSAHPEVVRCKVALAECAALLSLDWQEKGRGSDFSFRGFALDRANSLWRFSKIIPDSLAGASAGLSSSATPFGKTVMERGHNEG